MIELGKEDLLSLTEATRTIPPIDGKRPHVSSIWRWIHVGIRGVHLEHLKIGRRIVTSREALQRFFHTLSETPTPERPYSLRPPKPRTEKQRQEALAKARKSLKAHGIKVDGGCSSNALSVQLPLADFHELNTFFNA